MSRFYSTHYCSFPLSGIHGEWILSFEYAILSVLHIGWRPISNLYVVHAFVSLSCIAARSSCLKFSMHECLIVYYFLLVYYFLSSHLAFYSALIYLHLSVARINSLEFMMKDFFHGIVCSWCPTYRLPTDIAYGSRLESSIHILSSCFVLYLFSPRVHQWETTFIQTAFIHRQSEFFSSSLVLYDLILWHVRSWYMSSVQYS